MYNNPKWLNDVLRTGDKFANMAEHRLWKKRPPDRTRDEPPVCRSPGWYALETHQKMKKEYKETRP